MPKSWFSDPFLFRSGRRDRRSFAQLVLVCFAVEIAIAGWIFVPAYFANQRYLALVATGQPLPEPTSASGLSLLLGLSIGLIRLSALAAASVALARDVSGIAVNASGNVDLHDIQNLRLRVKEIAKQEVPERGK